MIFLGIGCCSSLSLSLSRSLSLSLFTSKHIHKIHSLSLTHIHTFFLSLTHAHTLSLSLKPTHTQFDAKREEEKKERYREKNETDREIEKSRPCYIRCAQKDRKKRKTQTEKEEKIDRETERKDRRTERKLSMFNVIFDRLKKTGRQKKGKKQTEK